MDSTAKKPQTPATSHKKAFDDKFASGIKMVAKKKLTKPIGMCFSSDKRAKKANEPKTDLNGGKKVSLFQTPEMKSKQAQKATGQSSTKATPMTTSKKIATPIETRKRKQVTSELAQEKVVIKAKPMPTFKKPLAANLDLNKAAKQKSVEATQAKRRRSQSVDLKYKPVIKERLARDTVVGNLVVEKN